MRIEIRSCFLFIEKYIQSWYALTHIQESSALGTQSHSVVTDAVLSVGSADQLSIQSMSPLPCACDLFSAPRSAAIGKFVVGFFLKAHQEGGVDYT